MIIVRAHEVQGYLAQPPYERVLKVLISPDLQPVKSISVGMTLLPPGKASSSHIHVAEEETWYILSGRGAVVVDGERQEVSADTVITVTPTQQHQLINTGDETLKVLWIYTPPGAERAVLDTKHV